MRAERPFPVPLLKTDETAAHRFTSSDALSVPFHALTDALRLRATVVVAGRAAARSRTAGFARLTEAGGEERWQRVRDRQASCPGHGRAVSGLASGTSATSGEGAVRD